MSAAAVTVSLPASGASVELAISAGMPCFQAGGGAAGAAVWAMVCPMPSVKTAAQTAIFLNIKKAPEGLMNKLPKAYRCQIFVGRG